MAKLAADEPDADGVEWLSTTNPDGTVIERVFPLPMSFANVKRGFSERRWQDAKGWARKKLARTSNRKYRPSEKQKPDSTVTTGQGQQAPRLPVLPAEDGTLPHRAIPRVDDPPPRRHLLVVSVQHPDSSKTAPNGRANRRLSGRPPSRRPASSPHQHRGAARRRAVQPGGARFPCDNRRRSDGRWQMKKMMRLVRPQSGKRENGRSGTWRGWRRKTGWGRSFKGDIFLLHYL